MGQLDIVSQLMVLRQDLGLGYRGCDDGIAVALITLRDLVQDELDVEHEVVGIGATNIEQRRQHITNLEELDHVDIFLRELTAGIQLTENCHIGLVLAHEGRSVQVAGASQANHLGDQQLRRHRQIPEKRVGPVEVRVDRELSEVRSQLLHRGQ